MPYIYSLAWKTTQTGAPFMRALFMDFPEDKEVRDMKYQYMFGPALLVAPVYEAGKTQHEVYLPKGTGWYDFWTEAHYEGGQTVTVDVPLDTIPLFVKAGSILPLGEVVEHVGIPQNLTEIRVYKGANASFDLYNDDGLTYDYEDGNYALATLNWNDAKQAFTADGDTETLLDKDWMKLLRYIG
jgi:alpha-D-xyloside xylohydrolase